MSDKFVFPGDQLSTTEELLPGDGTFEEDGIIRAARIGHYVVDGNHHQAIVKPLTSTPILVQSGDIIIGEVISIRSSMVVINIQHVKGKNRRISGENIGTIRVSEIANGYVKDACTEFGIGDSVRAKVTQVAPSIQLTTKDRHFGAIKSLCPKCRHNLTPKAQAMLECSHCGYRIKRKTTDDYGKLNLDEM